MSILKKVLSMALVLCMSLSFSATAFAAGIDADDTVQPITNSIEEIDALLVAASILNSPDAENDILASENTTLNDILPLYSGCGEIVAYYVSFAPTGYAVVNNNRSNPAVIEFGEGGHPLIEDILSVENNPYIIYNNPTEVFSANSLDAEVQEMANQANSADLYSYYPALKEENALAAARLDQLKQMLVPENSVYGSGGYGFIDLGNMPSGSYSSDTITKASTTDWATTGEFSEIAKNHCAATAVTNFALYFANRGHSNLKIDTVYKTFEAVHKIVGNGPVMTIADEAKDYFSDRGYTLKTSSVGTFSGIITAVTNERPSGILLANGIVDWHWVICVGYRAYSSGDNYMRIVDGWNDTIDRFYLIHSGSMWWSATEYWVE